MRPWYQLKVSPAQCVVSVKHLQNQGWYSNIPSMVKSQLEFVNTHLSFGSALYMYTPQHTIPAMLVNAPTLCLLASPCCQDCADVEASSVGDPA